MLNKNWDILLLLGLFSSDKSLVIMYLLSFPHFDNNLSRSLSYSIEKKVGKWKIINKNDQNIYLFFLLSLPEKCEH